MSNVTIDSKLLNLLLGAAIEQQNVMTREPNEWTDEPAEMSRELVRLQHDVSALEDAFTDARRLLNEAEERHNMEITVKLPQLDTLDARLEDIETCLKTLLESNRKFNATPTVVQPSVLMTATPEPEKPEPVRRGRRRKAELISTTSVATSVISGNGKDDADQEAADVEAEDTLRARTQFESKRVARTFGIGASRAVIKKVAGANVVNIDDVPAWQLLTLLGELQAM